MSARQLMALVKSHVEGDVQQFFTTALQAAADEARQGHARVAKELRDLVDKGRTREGAPSLLTSAAILAKPRGDLAALMTADYPAVRLSNMVLDVSTRARLERILHEQAQAGKLLTHNLQPRRKLLLVGPPGTGKTMTASAIAAELKLPLLTIRLEGVITKFLGETAQKLSSVFEAMTNTLGVYLFDEFDAIGARRTSTNDVGEIRRVLNSFLQMLENDRSASVIVCATNHAELLDPALFRRFDDVLEYRLPSEDAIRNLMESRLGPWPLDVTWPTVAATASGLSQAELSRAAEEAAKTAVLGDATQVTTAMLLDAIKERLQAPR